MTATTTHATRETYLQAAVEALRPRFEAIGMPLPEAVQVSVGFPQTSRGGRIGECWASAASDGVATIFVHPSMSDPVQVLGVLVHELIHAADDCEHGHKGPFVRAMKALGLDGKPTATGPGAMAEELEELDRELGGYPHKALKAGTGSSGPRKQGTRQLLVLCPQESGYKARMTRTWLDTYGAPYCPCHGEVMLEG